MSSLYIHIPFCKKACHYCDFHFSTLQFQKDEMINAICQELYLQKNYLQNIPLKSIYFGGGTPSLLDSQHLEKIFDAIYKNYQVENNAEITLEANPDDLHREKIKYLYSTPINRLSIGIQSFHGAHLLFLNRSHTDTQACNSIKNAQDIGFDNISIDLIYALPSPDHVIWKKDLLTAISFQISHISAYCLTIEEKTAFGTWVKKGTMKPVDDTHAIEQYHMLVEILTQNNYQQYEVSNFCQEGMLSKHNTNYWLKNAYLGIGPSAHSYNKISRQFNIKNNTLYIKNIQKNNIPYEREVLSTEDHVNEYIMTSLRTQWGCDIKKIEALWFPNFYSDNQNYLLECLDKGWIIQKNKIVYLTQKGMLLADQIASELFIIE